MSPVSGAPFVFTPGCVPETSLTTVSSDRLRLAAGSGIIGRSDIEKLSSIVALTKVKEIWCPVTGLYLIKFSIKEEVADAYQHTGQIWKNGVAFGTLRTNNTLNYVEFSESLNFAADDLIQLYVGSGGAVNGTYLQNFRLWGYMSPAFVTLD